MKKEIEKLVYKSLDSSLSEKESELLNNELQKSSSLRKELKLLIDLRIFAGKSVNPDFKPFFEERLANKLYSQNKNTFSFNEQYSLFSYSFRKFATAAIILLVILVSYNIINGNNYSFENLLGKSGSSIEYAFDPIQNLLGSNN